MTSFLSTSQPTLFCISDGLHILCLSFSMLPMFLRKMEEVDTKTIISSIIVARSKEGYQKNRLETPVWLIYSHWSNQLVFTKTWYIWYNHLQALMERLDTKSSMHTKQPFISSILPQFSIQKYQKHQLEEPVHFIKYYFMYVTCHLCRIRYQKQGLVTRVHQKSHSHVDWWLVFDLGSQSLCTRNLTQILIAD